MDGLILGRYRLDELLGSGGMAEVWLATDEWSGRHVAVKRLHPHLATDPAMVERFGHEALSAAAVDHPNVVKVLETGRDAIVLEYVQGQTLADRIRQGPVDAALVERTGTTLATALAAVHAAGFVHRDVTPGNVILDDAGVAHLIDFGIARPIDIAHDVTATGSLLGTWRYVAPEVMAGAAATPASDIWSLGATLYEALAGHPPYPATSPLELVEARRREVPPIDGGPLAGLITQMLDPDPARRPSAAIVSNALATSPEAVTQVLTIPAQGPDTAEDPVGVAALPPARPPERKRAAVPARLAGMAVAALLVGAVIMLAAAGAARPAVSGSPSAIPSQSSAASTATQPSTTAAPTDSPAPLVTTAHGHGRGHHGKHGG